MRTARKTRKPVGARHVKTTAGQPITPWHEHRLFHAAEKAVMAYGQAQFDSGRDVQNRKLAAEADRLRDKALDIVKDAIYARRK